VKLSDRVKPIQPTTGVQGRAATANLVAETPDDDPDKADLLLRLAEHHAKQQRFWRLTSIKPAVPAKPRTR